MANVKVSELTELTTPAADDLLLIVDDSEAGGEQSKYVTYENLAKVLLPPGMVAPFACSTPAGWLQCDGQAVSRTTYANLFAVISDDYGNGDGSTTFNLPDYRGSFLRMIDTGVVEGAAGNDPDAATRTDRGDGTGGDVVGTKQAYQVGPHTHPLDIYGTAAGGTYRIAGVLKDTDLGDQSTKANTGDESRPINVSVNYCIKF